MKKPLWDSANAENGNGTTRISIASVQCDGCGLPASLDADRLCFHCRRFPSSKFRQRHAAVAAGATGVSAAAAAGE